VQARQWDDAIRSAHTFKGLCASLGAEPIRLLVAELEHALHERDIAASIARLEMVGAALAPLVGGLDLHFSGCPPVEPVADGNRVPMALGDSDWLSKLRQLLREGDDEAREMWNARPAEVDARLPFPVVQRVSQALVQYEFDTALRVLPEALDVDP